MEKGMLIGAVISTHQGEEGIIIDKAEATCNGASYTVYVLARKDKTVFNIDYDDINEIIELPGGDLRYFEPEKFSL